MHATAGWGLKRLPLPNPPIHRSAWKVHPHTFAAAWFSEVRVIALGGSLGSKNIRTGEASPVKSGDRRPEQQPLVVPQRQGLWLVVYLPVQWPLPPRRGTTACPTIVAHITKTDACSF